MNYIGIGDNSKPKETITNRNSGEEVTFQAITGLADYTTYKWTVKVYDNADETTSMDNSCTTLCTHPTWNYR